MSTGLLLGLGLAAGVGVWALTKSGGGTSPSGTSKPKPPPGYVYGPGGVLHVAPEMVDDVLSTLSLYNPSPLPLGTVPEGETWVEAIQPPLTPYTSREWALQAYNSDLYVWVPAKIVNHFFLAGTPDIEPPTDADGTVYALLLEPGKPLPTAQEAGETFNPYAPPPQAGPIPPGGDMPFPQIPPGMIPPGMIPPGMNIPGITPPPPQQGGPGGGNQPPWPGGGYWFPPGTVPGMPQGGSIPTIPGTPPPAYIPPGGLPPVHEFVVGKKLPSEVSYYYTGNIGKWRDIPDANPNAGLKIVDNKGKTVDKTSNKAWALVPWEKGQVINLPADWPIKPPMPGN